MNGMSRHAALANIRPSSPTVPPFAAGHPCPVYQGRAGIHPAFHERRLCMRFAIVGLKRTGSSYLINLLGGHPEIHCCGEIFNPDGVNLRWPKDSGGRRAARELEKEIESLRQD